MSEREDRGGRAEKMTAQQAVSFRRKLHKTLMDFKKTILTVSWPERD